MIKNNWKLAEKILKRDGLIVAPTDTLYGILASALSKRSIKKIYAVKGRDEGKPCIVLINSIKDLEKFGVKLDGEQEKFLGRVWPGKISVILPVPNKKFEYLHRGTQTVAFRMIGPRNINLFNLIKSVGPLAAPSANPQGQTPARSMWEAKKYFGENIDIYMCGGTKDASRASTLVEYKGGELKILRQGTVKI